MFTTDPTIVDLKIKERNLYKAIFSMNFHQVAIPEHGVDEARCYIFFFREGDKLSAYIVLYMPSTGRRLYYTYSSNPFPEIDLPMVEDVARAFGEDMGFFLDEKSFASSSVVEKNLWIDEQPIFGFKATEEHADAVGTTETIAVPAAAADDGANTITEAPAPPVLQPTPLAPEYQTAPMPPAAQPMSAAPVYQQAPAQPVPTTPPAAPVYYQPAPPAATAQPTPAAPVYYEPAPPAPAAQPTPAAPVYYQPAPAAPAAPQTPPQTMYHKEIESQVEVEADARSPRQENSAVSHSSTEKVKAAGAASRIARPVRSNPLEGEPRTTQKNPPPAPKQQVKKETRGAIGVVGREMEALARLMASF